MIEDAKVDCFDPAPALTKARLRRRDSLKSRLRHRPRPLARFGLKSHHSNWLREMTSLRDSAIRRL